MSQISSLFVTRLYHAELAEHGDPVDMAELEASCWSIADDDQAGQEWCEKNGYPGYTSYASLTDLAWRFPAFEDLDSHDPNFNYPRNQMTRSIPTFRTRLRTARSIANPPPMPQHECHFNFDHLTNYLK